MFHLPTHPSHLCQSLTYCAFVMPIRLVSFIMITFLSPSLYTYYYYYHCFTSLLLLLFYFIYYYYIFIFIFFYYYYYRTYLLSFLLYLFLLLYETHSSLHTLKQLSKPFFHHCSFSRILLSLFSRSVSFLINTIQVLHLS